MILRAAKCLHAFPVARAGLINRTGHGCGTDEADGLDVRMRQQTVHGGAVALHNVEHAVRNAGPL